MPEPERFRLIGFSGEMGVGKDEAAKALLGLGYQRIAFGDALKSMAMHGLGLTWDQVHGSQEEKAKELEWLRPGNSPRRILQTLGTEWGRELIDPNLWVEVVRRAVLARPGGLVVIPDVRFENEAEMIRDMGGTVIHVRRGQQKRVGWLRSLFNRKHASERMPEVAQGDKVLMNNKTVADLHTAVRHIVFLDLGGSDFEGWVDYERGVVSGGRDREVESGNGSRACSGDCGSAPPSSRPLGTEGSVPLVRGGFGGGPGTLRP